MVCPQELYSVTTQPVICATTDLAEFAKIKIEQYWQTSTHPNYI